MYRAVQPERPRRRANLATIAINAGRPAREPGAPLGFPPVPASAFHAGSDLGYARQGGVGWEPFEAALGELEGGEAVAFSSGMAAAAAILEVVSGRATPAIARDAHVEVRQLITRRAHAAGSDAPTLVDAADEAAIAAWAPAAEVLWVDSISNPGLDVAALDAIGSHRSPDSILVVDATLATPVLQRPLELGADVVLHSATKYIGGHSDLMLGVAVARDPALATALREVRTSVGAIPGTLECFLALRGLRTLPLRMERSQANATALSKRLAAHPGVERIRYPGRTGDPAHAAALRLLDGFGGILAFEASGGPERAVAICEEVELFTHATSLGGVESLIERSAHWHGAAEISPALLRTSVGCEHPDDLWADLERALRRSGRRCHRVPATDQSAAAASRRAASRTRIA